MNLRKILAEVSDTEIQEGLKATDVLIGAEWEFEFKNKIAEEMKEQGGSPKTEKYLEQVAGAPINFQPWLENRSHTEKKTWVLERDTSLSEIAGAELVCPPMPLQEFLKVCPRILHAIGKLGKTTNQCGLHINISIPELFENVHLLKLMLLIDEDRVYKAFNKKARMEAGGPVKELLKRVIKNSIKVKPEQLKSGKLIKPIEEDLEIELRSYLVKEFGINPGKLAAGYIEFRYMGGSGYHKKWDKIEELIGMYVFMLKAATDIHYKQDEYQQKLSDLINKEFEAQQHLIKDTRDWLRKFKPLLQALKTKLTKVERSVGILYLYTKPEDNLFKDFVEHTRTMLKYDEFRHAIVVDVEENHDKLLSSGLYKKYPELRKKADKVTSNVEKQLKELGLPKPDDFEIRLRDEEILFFFIRGVIKPGELQQLKPLDSGIRYNTNIHHLCDWISFPIN